MELVDELLIFSVLVGKEKKFAFRFGKWHVNTRFSSPKQSNNFMGKNETS